MRRGWEEWKVLLRHNRPREECPPAGGENCFSINIIVRSTFNLISEALNIAYSIWQGKKALVGKGHKAQNCEQPEMGNRMIGIVFSCYSFSLTYPPTLNNQSIPFFAICPPFNPSVKHLKALTHSFPPMARRKQHIVWSNWKMGMWFLEKGDKDVWMRNTSVCFRKRCVCSTHIFIFRREGSETLEP